MESTVLLTVIAVATLLVAVVGATFAYYTATTTSSGEGTNAQVQTEVLEGTTFTFNSASEKHDYLAYPGGLGVFGAKAEFLKSGSTDNNEYNLTFDLEIDYKNKTATNLYWALYMVEGTGDGKNEDPLSTKLDPACKLNVLPGQGVELNETHYWYADTQSAEDNSGKSCTLTVDQKATLANTNMIAYGTFESNTENGKIDSKTTGEELGQGTQSTDNEASPSTCDKKLCNPNSSENPLLGRTLTTKKENGANVKYYYLVVQYPNENSPQEQGDGETTDIEVTLKVADKSAKAVIAA